MIANGCLQAARTSLRGQWELISAGRGLAQGEKIADVMDRLFSWVTSCMPTDVIDEVISCVNFT